MRSANRDRPDHRGTALRAVTAVLLIGILLIVPASANTATYYVAENGTSFSAEVTLVNQSGYLLISPGFIGEGAELKVTNLTLTAENGTVVNTTKKSSTQIAFPEGNYTLVYDAPLDGYLMYAQYLSPFNTTVFLPAGFHTNNVLLGPVSNGGVTYNLKKDRVQLHNLGIIADGTQYETVVVWTDRQEIQMRFYPASYEKYFVICMGLWFILFCAVGYRYWRLKRKANQYF
ncbi:MAG: DUF5803 family protein [Methanocorpusculum sp.]|nr:DUF5803 family protein [Methanocorpusculum sp.]MDE2524650.1 DUF5803 family protein [Methanocorpusculum sp.]